MGVDDLFFDFGGYLLLVIKFVVVVCNVFGVDVGVWEIFEFVMVIVLVGYIDMLDLDLVRLWLIWVDYDGLV